MTRIGSTGNAGNIGPIDPESLDTGAIEKSIEEDLSLADDMGEVWGVFGRASLKGSAPPKLGSSGVSGVANVSTPDNEGESRKKVKVEEESDTSFTGLGDQHEAYDPGLVKKMMMDEITSIQKSLKTNKNLDISFRIQYVMNLMQQFGTQKIGVLTGTQNNMNKYLRETTELSTIVEKARTATREEASGQLTKDLTDKVNQMLTRIDADEKRGLFDKDTANQLRDPLKAILRCLAEDSEGLYYLWSNYEGNLGKGDVDPPKELEDAATNTQYLRNSVNDEQRNNSIKWFKDAISKHHPQDAKPPLRNSDYKKLNQLDAFARRYQRGDPPVSDEQLISFMQNYRKENDVWEAPSGNSTPMNSMMSALGQLDQAFAGQSSSMNTMMQAEVGLFQTELDNLNNFTHMLQQLSAHFISNQKSQG